MSEEHPEPQSGATPSRFSGFHIRTFEAELLISGAVVFGLFQLPPLMSRYFETVLVRFDGHLRTVALLGQTYTALVVYALLGAFLLHLVLRAFWIGLVGLESVFPDGIKWDQVRSGPFFIANARRRIGTLAQLIDRVDDLCSLVFSFGFLIVIIFIYFAVLALVSAFSGFLISTLLLGGRWSAQIFWVIFGFVIFFPLATMIADNRLGSRIRVDGGSGRLMAFMMKVAYGMSPVRWMAPIQLTLGSNISSSRVTAAMNAVMLFLGIGVMAAMFAQAGVIRLDNLVFFPDTLRASGIDPRHYRNQRHEWQVEPLVPSIQSDVVEGPYLKLVIPYVPRRHNPLIRARCPELGPFRSPGLVVGRPDPPGDEEYRDAVDCLASLFQIGIDGDSLEEPWFEFTKDAVTGVAAIAGFVALTDLEAGRHELTVAAPSRAMSKGDADAEPVLHRIPFWWAGSTGGG
jgi:hypothetical protein